MAMRCKCCDRRQGSHCCSIAHTCNPEGCGCLAMCEGPFSFSNDQLTSSCCCCCRSCCCCCRCLLISATAAAAARPPPGGSHGGVPAPPGRPPDGGRVCGAGSKLGGRRWLSIVRQSVAHFARVGGLAGCHRGSVGIRRGCRILHRRQVQKVRVPASPGTQWKG